MADLFKQLQEAKASQEQVLRDGVSSNWQQESSSQKDAQKPAQKVEQISKTASKPLSKELRKLLSQDAIEELAFTLRKTPQGKVNANIPHEWKEDLDDLAFRLKVGKYELLTYIIGVFLGKVEAPER